MSWFSKRKYNKETEELIAIRDLRRKLIKDQEDFRLFREKFIKGLEDSEFKIQIERRKIDEEKNQLQTKKNFYEYLIDLFGDYFHEQKRINERINKAYETLDKVTPKHPYVESLNDKTLRLILNLSKTIAALADISNIRMEYLEFCIAPKLFENSESEKFYPYKLCEKIYKSINSGFDNEARDFNLDPGDNGCYCSYRTKRVLPIAFFILLDNAWKYTISEETIDLKFSEKGSVLVIDIVNWGPKLTNDELTKVTERGFRGEMARKTHSFSGKGLGLSIAKEILDVCEVKYEFLRISEEVRKYKGIDYEKFCVRLTFSNVQND